MGLILKNRMPYKNKVKDRYWHKLKMRERRRKLKLEGRFVTPGDDKSLVIGLVLHGDSVYLD